MFSKMNSGQPPSNWRMIDNGGVPTSQGGRGTSGAESSGRGDLNRSFRRDDGRENDEEDEEDGYDQEIDEDNEGGEDEDDEDNN